MTTLTLTQIQFPEIQLPTSAAHQLRGYFGNLFREKSPLLHNHYDDGRVMYRYPLVQYKILDGHPTLLGINDGATLLVELFLKIQNLDIHGKVYPVWHKNIQSQTVEIGVVETELYEYEFKTLWMALNQEKHHQYMRIDMAERKQLLNRQLQANLLSLSKGIGHWEEKTIMVKGTFTEKNTRFKNQEMLVFAGTFVTNMKLPDGVGLGKAVSRGFGTVGLV